MNNIMIDIETLGTDTNSVVLSLAALEFCPQTGKTGRQFYKKIDLNSAIALGLQINTDTLVWWTTQNTKQFTEMFKDAQPIHKVLELFVNWFRSPDMIIWANSPSFDLIIIENALRKANLPTPWKYINERCVRTMLALNPEAKKSVQKPENAHNALADCFYQISYLHKIFNSF